MPNLEVFHKYYVVLFILANPELGSVIILISQGKVRYSFPVSLVLALESLATKSVGVRRMEKRIEGERRENEQ